MRVIDLNGSDRWSVEGIRQRYAGYALEFQVAAPVELKPITRTDGENKWIFPIMEQVFTALVQGDAACAQLAIDLVCDDSRFAFGKIHKDKAATLLRRVLLSSDQKDRLRKRIVYMLEVGAVPPEYKCYAKLLRTIGLGPYREQLKSIAPRGPRIQRYLAYFQTFTT